MSKSKKKIIARSHNKSKTSKLDWFKQLSHYNKTTTGLFFLAVALPYFGWLLGSFFNPDGLLSFGSWSELNLTNESGDTDIYSWLYRIFGPALVGGICTVFYSSTNWAVNGSGGGAWTFVYKWINGRRSSE